MAQSNAETILATLKTALQPPHRTIPTDDAFATLIATIISQNTSGQNRDRAFGKLASKFRITPKSLAEADLSQIEDCLHTGGLYKNKAKAIKQVSKIIDEKYCGSLDAILAFPLPEARKTLMQLPSVGPKTADVVLLFCAKQPTIPVDTHVNRVSKRLGLTPANADYEIIRECLQTLYQPKDYLMVHVMLIAHGRRYCKVRNPLCTECPISRLCPSKEQ